MKKFYALIACAFMTLGMVLSAQVRPDFTKKVPDPSHLFQFDTSKAIEIPSMIKGNFVKKAPCRAGEEERIDITQFTQNIFYNYFFNFYYMTGLDANSWEERKEILNVMSAQETKFEVTSDNTIAITNFLGYDSDYFGLDLTNPELTFTEDGRWVMELGQKLFEYDGYTYQVVSVDNRGNAINNGEIEFDVFLNAIMFDGYLGAGAYNSNGKFVGFDVLDVCYYLFAPNSTLTYSYTFNDSQYNVEKQIFCDYYVGEEDDDYIDTIMLFNIIDSEIFTEGTAVTFYTVDSEAIAIDQYTIPSIYVDNSVGYSGDWYLYSLTDDDENPTTEVYGTWDMDQQILTWDNWYSYCPYMDYWLGLCGETKLYFDNLESNGISSVVKDNTNADPVYYNIQGMKVQNPTAGQLYIVKQGNKTTKQIFR